MPNNREYSKSEIAVAIRVFKKFLENSNTVILTDEFLEWCDEQMKGGKDECKRQNS